MTPRLKKLITSVKKLYNTSPSHENYAPNSWIFKHHVQVVADYAQKVAKKQKGNEEFVVAAAYLHDIADTVIKRSDKRHEQASLDMAQKLLHQHQYPPKEVEHILNEIIKPHSCKQLNPKTLNGKIFATADALAHFNADFYITLCWNNWHAHDLEGYKKWVSSKLERDYHVKIHFPYWRKYITPQYQALKLVFSQ